MDLEQIKFAIVTLVGLVIFMVVHKFVGEVLLSLTLAIAISMAIFTGLDAHIEYDGRYDD